MNYFKITNVGVAPEDCFTLLGLSTTRTSTTVGTIGQFGSGSKQGLNLLLRRGLKPTIFCGHKILKFDYEPLELNDGLDDIERHVVTMNGRKLGFCLEYGVDDWTDVSKACQEYVSNAIDRTLREGQPVSSIQLQLVDDIKPEENVTSVYIPASSEVVRFFSEIKERYLYFDHPDIAAETSVIPRTEHWSLGQDGCICYKNGVFVRIMKKRGFEPLFNYNLCDLQLDESRNSSDYSCKSSAAKALALYSTHDVKMTLLRSLTEGTDYIEHTHDRYDLRVGTATPKLAWCDAWEAVYGDKIICKDDLETVVRLLKRGHKVAVIRQPGWYDFLKIVGIKSSDDVSDMAERNGLTTVEPTATFVEAVENLWNILECEAVTANKSMPEVMGFRGGDITCLYDGGVVYLNADLSGLDLDRAILDASIEYITGYSSGYTQHSQFALKLAVVFMGR